ncbi:MAG TPA: uroporphyrinogen decarboxylase family protein [Spirochaetia bacterium]|nr:uroporphyrinogen decarboxylase family protein [Spirochaetia bacterium]
MNKRDLMLGLLESSHAPERIPAAFFLHFDPAFHRGQAAVNRHLEFFRATDMDFVKIQFEHPFPRRDIRRPEDWGDVPAYGLDFFEAPLRVVEGLVRAASREALVLLTLYSPFMLAGQTAGSETVVRHAQENPEAFKRGIAAITESLLGFVRECIKLGLDGFYSSTQGGEKGRFSDPRAFVECVRPHDLAVMEEINRRCRFNILHVCDYHLPYADLAPFADYPGHVVNTSLSLAGRQVSARDVAALFKRPFMGGLDRKGILAHGTPEEIRAAANAVLKDAPERFILAADCTVPADTPWENLHAAIQAAHDFKR